MRSFILLISIAWCAAEGQQIVSKFNQDPCIPDHHVVDAFRKAYDDYSINLYQRVAPHAHYFLTLAPLTIWIALAAVAEGSNQITQKEIFRALNLPHDLCSRQKFYWLATTRVLKGSHANIFNTNALLMDQGADINPYWYNLVQQQSLLDVILAPVKNHPRTTAEIIKQLLSLKDHQPIIKGNSVLLNSLDYKGLWTNAFPDAVIERAPFYSPTGQKMGSVDLMTVKRKVRIGYVASIKSKIVELPIGINGEYRLILALIVDKGTNVKPVVDTLKNNSLTEVVAALQDSPFPVKITLPRAVLNTELNLKPMLQDIGIVNLWNDPEATRYISNPAPHLSGFIHRASITFDVKGSQPPLFEYPSNFEATSDEDRFWGEFIANRPFMFGLFDAETYTCLVGSIFSRPTYP